MASKKKTVGIDVLSLIHTLGSSFDENKVITEADKDKIEPEIESLLRKDYLSDTQKSIIKRLGAVGPEYSNTFDVKTGSRGISNLANNIIINIANLNSSESANPSDKTKSKNKYQLSKASKHTREKIYARAICEAIAELATPEELPILQAEASSKKPCKLIEMLKSRRNFVHTLFAGGADTGSFDSYKKVLAGTDKNPSMASDSKSTRIAKK